MTTQHLAPTGHSVVGMSVLERRLGCPGSANAERGLPDRPTAAAERGSRIHEAAARALLENLSGEDAWMEDEEGAAIIDAYVDVVRATTHRLKGTLLIEHRFHLAHLHPELFGTADAVVIADDAVAVIDLKSGRGHRVDVRRPDGGPNLQLGGYGLGGLMAAKGGRARDLELHVVQPLHGGHTHTRLTPAEVIDLACDITAIVEDALAPDAPRAAGDWCRWCKAAATCPALRQHIEEQAQVDFADIEVEGAAALPQPHEMTSESLGRLLRVGGLIETWLGALRDAATAEARAGRPPQGYKLVERRGRRRWADVGEDRVAAALSALGVDPWKRDLISPAQAEKAAKAATKESGLKADLSDLITTTSPGTALVPEDDPRPAIASGPEVDFTE